MDGRRRMALSAALFVLMLAGLAIPRLPWLTLPSFGPIKLTTCLWIALAALMAFAVPETHGADRLSHQTRVQSLALSCALLIIAVEYALGFALAAVGKSPYDLSPLGITLNALDIVPAVLAQEMIRGGAINTSLLYSKRPAVWVVLITLSIGFAGMSTAKLAVAKDAEKIGVFLATEALPSLSMSCLMTVLAIHGGYRAAALYRATRTLAWRVLPLIPSLPWLAQGAVGITSPVIIALYIRDHALSQGKRVLRKGVLWADVVLLCVGVALIWFVVGVFPVYPSVILTGSMLPDVAPGDVVLVRKFTSEPEVYALTPGEIIHFRRGDIVITHRVVEIYTDDEGNLSFVTKGDNNASEDGRQVLPAELIGKVDHVVPKAGMISLLLHSANPVPEGVVEHEN